MWERRLPSSPHIRHLTVAGERWDLIAWKYYGDPTLYGPIVRANPAVPIVGAFDAGIVIQVTILQRASRISNDLPPWESL